MGYLKALFLRIVPALLVVGVLILVVTGRFAGSNVGDTNDILTTTKARAVAAAPDQTSKAIKAAGYMPVAFTSHGSADNEGTWYVNYTPCSGENIGRCFTDSGTMTSPRIKRAAVGNPLHVALVFGTEPVSVTLGGWACIPQKPLTAGALEALPEALAGAWKASPSATEATVNAARVAFACKVA